MPRLANSMVWSDIQQKPKNNSKKTELCWFSAHSYAFQWGKCPKNKAVKITLPALWPSAHQRQSSGHLVPLINALTQLCLTNHIFLTITFWAMTFGRGKTSFLVQQFPKEKKKEGWTWGGGAFILSRGRLFKNAPSGPFTWEWDLTSWGW